MNKMNRVLAILTDDMLMDMVQEVNSWDNSLSHLGYIDMDQLDEYLVDVSPTDLANMIHYGDFNPNDAYFNFNAYENLVSYSTYEMLEDLNTYKYEIVDRFIELYDEGHIEIFHAEVLDILDEIEE